jgi:ribose 5-phosphate isomerase
LDITDQMYLILDVMIYLLEVSFICEFEVKIKLIKGWHETQVVAKLFSEVVLVKELNERQRDAV